MTMRQAHKESKSINICLLDCPYNDFNALFDSLHEDADIDRIDMNEKFLNCLPPNVVLEFFQVLGRIKSLKEIYLASGTFNVKVISKLIENACHLNVLSMTKVTLSGTHDDFLEFDYTLFMNRTIQTFILSDFNLDSAANWTLDRIVMALSRCVSLKTLTIKSSCSSSEGALSVSALAQFCNISKAEFISVSGIRRDSESCIESDWGLMRCLLSMRGGMNLNRAIVLKQ
jgi:hypothetical protein